MLKASIPPSDAEHAADMAEFYHHGELLSVMTTQPLGRALDYRAPEGGCHAGAFVEVPLGPRKVMGVVWGPGPGITTSTRCAM